MHFRASQTSSHRVVGNDFLHQEGTISGPTVLTIMEASRADWILGTGDGFKLAGPGATDNT